MMHNFKHLRNKLIPLILVLLLIGTGVGLLVAKKQSEIKSDKTSAGNSSVSVPAVINKVVFKCDDKKTISAEFNQKSVLLKLSDKRELTLPEVISASGARYANEDESLVFWNKGETAFLMEGRQTTYSDCTADQASQGEKISVTGVMICLPHKNTSGPQTMECAYGLKGDNGKYYGLTDSDPGYKNIMSLPMNKKVEVTGRFISKDDQRYQSIGTITVESIKPLD